MKVFDLLLAMPKLGRHEGQPAARAGADLAVEDDRRPIGPPAFRASRWRQTASGRSGARVTTTIAPNPNPKLNAWCPRCEEWTLRTNRHECLVL
jgi:hypothetical protein